VLVSKPNFEVLNGVGFDTYLRDEMEAASEVASAA
jgi:hypothetical protein